MTEEILKVSHLNKFYGDWQALHDINFDLKKGEVLALLGPSGSGKSTLIRCLNGLEEYCDGEIVFNGAKVEPSEKNWQRLRQKIGMVFQSYDLFPNMTVLENILLGPTKVQKRDRATVEQEALHINMPADWMAVLAFSLWVAAEFSDIVRGAIQSVPQHQRESGLAIGLTRFQLFRYILLPQAMKLEVPAAINLATRVVKTTSLLMIISIMDVINVGQQIIEANNSTYPTGVFWVYGLIFFLYFIVDYLLSLWARKLTARQ